MIIQRILVCLLAFVLIGNAVAVGSPTITVDVKGPDGRPAKGATVRFDRIDKRTAPVVATTDARGHAALSNIGAGRYRLSAISESGSKSFQIFSTDATKQLLFTFDMKPLAGSGSKDLKKKIYVWVDTNTGTHLGGHYEELDPKSPRRHASGVNVDVINPQSMDELTPNHNYIRPPVIP